MASPFEDSFVDPLYGEVRLEPPIGDLATRPLLQRLRFVRLSNIDSLASPGISNISRYEHALGTSILAASTSFANRVAPRIRIPFIATALIHDTGITPFGHLMEEAFRYSDVDYHHENVWSVLLEERSDKELGGVNLQLYLGFQSGLREWAEKFFGIDEGAVIEEIAKGIRGKGRFGSAIVGEMDLDNLDNVSRAAFHIGLPLDRRLPLRIAACLEDVSEDGAVFSSEAVGPIGDWLLLREQVYSRFMLPRGDFSGKLMLLFSMVQALKLGVLTAKNWNYTDAQLLDTLSNAQQDEISTTARRWLTADLWDISDLIWFEGRIPSLSALNPYAAELSSALSRPCFAYRIKDKRKRKVELRLSSRETVTLGENPRLWLFGVGSPLKKPFTAKENKTIVEVARGHFDAELAFSSEHSGSLFA